MTQYVSPSRYSILNALDCVDEGQQERRGDAVLLVSHLRVQDGMRGQEMGREREMKGRGKQRERER
jgi:hypothetical protein